MIVIRTPYGYVGHGTDRAHYEDALHFDTLTAAYIAGACYDRTEVLRWNGTVWEKVAP